MPLAIFFGCGRLELPRAMQAKDHKRISKKLSYILRHDPASVGVTLNKQGYVEIPVLLKALKSKGVHVSTSDLDTIVEMNDKQRFSIVEEKGRRFIRASQGHSISGIDLSLPPAIPPTVVYHGTVNKYIESILSKGLVPGSRNHVHLSPDIETAKKVGSRRGKPVILGISAGIMHGKGHTFYVSKNGVWLTEHVPPQYIAFVWNQ